MEYQEPIRPKNNRKYILYILLLVLLIGILIVHFNNNDTVVTPKKLICYTKPKYDVSIIGAADSIDLLYNYKKNKQSYEITFLEFGAIRCTACKMMVPVLDQIREKYKGRVNVVFLNVTNDQGSKYANYFNVQLIPCQVLLDNKGEEIFRHTDTISVEKLDEVFELYLTKK